MADPDAGLPVLAHAGVPVDAHGRQAGREHVVPLLRV
jgi:hypothetical protein